MFPTHKIEINSSCQSQIKRYCSSNNQNLNHKSKIMLFLNVLKQTKNSSTGLLALGLFSTLLIVGGYRYVIDPKLKKKRFNEARAYADFVFEQEQQEHRNKQSELVKE